MSVIQNLGDGTHGLVILPNEIILLIVDELVDDLATLNSLAQVNSVLRAAAIPHIYRETRFEGSKEKFRRGMALILHPSIARCIRSLLLRISCMVPTTRDVVWESVHNRYDANGAMIADWCAEWVMAVSSLLRACSSKLQVLELDCSDLFLLGDVAKSGHGRDVITNINNAFREQERSVLFNSFFAGFKSSLSAFDFPCLHTLILKINEKTSYILPPDCNRRISHQLFTNLGRLKNLKCEVSVRSSIGRNPCYAAHALKLASKLQLESFSLMFYYCLDESSKQPIFTSSLYSHNTLSCKNVEFGGFEYRGSLGLSSIILTLKNMSFLSLESVTITYSSTTPLGNSQSWSAVFDACRGLSTLNSVHFRNLRYSTSRCKYTDSAICSERLEDRLALEQLEGILNMRGSSYAWNRSNICKHLQELG